MSPNDPPLTEERCVFCFRFMFIVLLFYRFLSLFLVLGSPWEMARFRWGYFDSKRQAEVEALETAKAHKMDLVVWHLLYEIETAGSVVSIFILYYAHAKYT